MIIKSSVLVIVLALLCFLIPFQAGASPARMSAMMLDQSTYWMISLDETLFALNPAILAELRPQVWGQLAPGYAGGIIVSPAKNINLYIVTGMPVAFGGFGGPVPATANQEQVRLGASMVLGQLDIGVTAMYTNMSASDDTTGQKDNATVYDIGGGVIFVITPGTMNLDVAGDVKIWNLHAETDAGETYDTLTFDITALGRLNWKMIQNNTFHIFGEFGLFDRSYTPNAGSKVKQTTTGVLAGFSDEIQFTDSIMAFAGGLFTMGINSNDTTDVTAYEVDAVAGLEVAIIKEAIVRVGISHQFWYFGTDKDAETSGTTGANYATDLNCGLGVRLGELLVDAELNPAIFSQGPNFISGANNTLTVMLNVTYYLGQSQGILK
jgi:hypothetical protein